MQIPELSDKQVEELGRNLDREIGQHPLGWHEGLEIVGYWPNGDSFIFKSENDHICISASFIDELTRWHRRKNG